MNKDQEYDGSTMLESVQQETFTDKALIFNQTESYLQAYTDCSSREVAKAAASRLLTNVNVNARLAYKRTQLAIKTEITKETQIIRLKELSVAGQKVRQISAAVSAEDRINTILGYYAEDNAQKRESIFDILAIVGLNAELAAPVGPVGLLMGDNKVIEGKQNE